MMKGIIEARQLSTGYGKKIVLKDQNIVIPKNKITVILGPNGCGKSTADQIVERNYLSFRRQIFISGA